MTPRRLFVLNAVIAGFYGIALLAVTDPILDIYGIRANADGVYMARWFGLGLIATGLVTWLTRDAADSDTGRAIGRALAVTYGLGTILALWGTVFGPFNALGVVAVGLNLLLGSGFGWLGFLEPRTTHPTPSS
jgi:hypothetical protein